MVVLRRVLEDLVHGKPREDHQYNYMGLFIDNPRYFY